MGAEQEIGLCADRRAHLPHEALAALKIGKPQLSAVEGAVGPGRIKFEGGETLRQILSRAFRGEVRVVIDVGAIPRARIEVGVGAQSLVHPAAQELVDRLAGLLADNVPAGHLERT